MTEYSADDFQTHIERLRKDKTVALEQVTLLHRWLERKRSSRQCGRVTGESRTGKTKACDAYLKKYGKPDFSSKVPVIPVGYILPKQECTSRELFRQILGHYNFDLPKGTVGDARSLVFKVLRESKTEVLFIDEADRLKKKTFADVRDIFDELKIAVILIGTKKRLDLAVQEDEQVYNRFRSNYRMGTIQSNQLKELVGVWERDIIALPVASHLTTESMLKLIRVATGAAQRGYYIGLIDMVLREAAIRSLEQGMMQIDQAILKEVSEEYK
ncbi:TniB family NTP-binding protein [Pantanalinema sp. GBBB05]|uniref:TniB family NTP-binding protein n=1 Tax=Pantanalinema sp. GBBB05 TaxID=2604139 RepID=UPI003D81B028